VLYAEFGRRRLVMNHSRCGRTTTGGHDCPASHQPDARPRGFALADAGREPGDGRRVETVAISPRRQPSADPVNQLDREQRVAAEAKKSSSRDAVEPSTSANACRVVPRRCGARAAPRSFRLGQGPAVQLAVRGQRPTRRGDDGRRTMCSGSRLPESAIRKRPARRPAPVATTVPTEESPPPARHRRARTGRPRSRRARSGAPRFTWSRLGRRTPTGRRVQRRGRRCDTSGAKDKHEPLRVTPTDRHAESQHRPAR